MIPDEERRPGMVAEAAGEDQAKSLDVKIPQDGDARPYSIALHSQHAAMLAASGISPNWASKRGYVTVDTKKLLKDLGVARGGQQVPGLLIPMCRKDGSRWGVQYRPDVPRVRDGKDVKYETPFEQPNGIDVPPEVGPQLDDPSITLYITEGVKKADAAAERGLCCVALAGVWSWLGTNAKGGKTALADWRDIALNDREVVLAFDSDVVIKPQVRAALAALAIYLASKGACIKYLHLPDDGNGKTGLDDYLCGHTVEDLKQLIRAEPPGPTAGHGDPGSDHGSSDPEPLDLAAQKALTALRVGPVLSAEAFQGLPGRVVRAVEPYTEAGNAALLVTFLAAAGIMLGPGSYVLAGDAEHAGRVWPLIVGNTAGGMKGTSLAVIRRILLAADPSFAGNMDGGLSTGEGLIERVRDSTGYPEDKDFDEGVEDKRLLVVESEFAAVLGRGGRDGNSLSEIQRQAWDGLPMSTMTRKTNRLRATSTHIGIIGHITPTELCAKLSASDVSGGLMNRYLPVHSERSKRLPDGGTTPDDVVAMLGKELADALAEAKSHTGSVARDQDASVLWRKVYDELTPDVPDGPLAAIIARAVPQVLRLSLIYALLDEQKHRVAVIRVEHLTAALAVWRYIEASARRIFGDLAANRDLVKLAAAIDDAGIDGLTRNDIRELFARHKKRGELDDVLRQLVITGRYEAIIEPTPGRSATRYRALHGPDPRDKRDKHTNGAEALTLDGVG